LYDITGVQRQLAKGLRHKLENQMEIVDRMNQHMEGTQNCMQKANNALKELKTAESTWFAWVLCVALIIALILVAVLWKK
jgi:t-SNARE complex subunit (syntaxin)